MAPTFSNSINLLALLFSGLFFFSLSDARSSSAPYSIAIPVWKDGRTLQYLTHIAQGTPPISPSLVLDLGGPFLWVDCQSGYLSPSYFPVRCRSIQCSASRPTGTGTCNCNDNNINDICPLSPQNTLSHESASGQLVEDTLTFPVPPTQGRFLFSCAPTFLLRSLAGGAKGMLGLGRSRISLPSQIAAAFGFHRKFAICLPSSSMQSPSEGALFFGDGPYVLDPDMDASKYLMYTPLIGNSNVPQVADHFIGVNSIKINGKFVPLIASLLSIDAEGMGGTKISTVVPYTTMETTVFVALTEAFSEAAINSFNMSRVASVPPFKVCFSSNNMGTSKTGPVVPTIDLVLQSKMVYWRIWGSNSMVRVNEDVLCLAMLDGGRRPISSIVIGGYQLENNLLQFDLTSSRLGFSSSLLSRQTTCSAFPGGYSYQR